jgi:hypothetical protein
MNKFLLSVAAMAVVATACSDDDDNGITGPNATREYVQIERLGNPLVSEVFFLKRDHGLHNTSIPATDEANGFKTKIETFIRDVAGRNATVQTTVSSVLVPDMLLVFPNRSPASSGWLGWALANGWGGRNLADDVVDAGLAAVFGNLLAARNTSPGLASDNVGANDKPFVAMFPYLAAPTQ